MDVIQPSVRMIIQWHGSGEQERERVERVVWIDYPARRRIALIDIFDKTAWPHIKPYDEIAAALASGAGHILETDPYDSYIPTGDGLTANASRYRDRAFDAIKELIEDKTGGVFYPRIRGKLVREAATRAGRSRSAIEKDLRRWWQRGMKKNALYPDHHRGGAGKGQTHRSGAVKRGRPHGSGNSVGVNIDDHTRDLIIKGLKQHYEVPRAKRRRFSSACQEVREEYFNTGIEFRDGGWKYTLPDASRMPTDGQMRYWYNKERDSEEVYRKTYGERAYNLRIRERLGDTSDMECRPYAQLQLDSTEPDIVLVSEFDPLSIIGSPTLYTAKAPYARIIGGLNVTLGSPSWVGGMELVVNVAEDKVEFCQRYGITIAQEDWPCHHLPEEWLADGGEYKGYNSDVLVDPLGIPLGNTGSDRGDQKGVVERDFLMIDEELIGDLPGAKRSDWERGEVDPAKTACLTMRQFTILMIHRAIAYNKAHRLSEYPLTKDMIIHKVRPYPNDIWFWGVANLGAPHEVRQERLDGIRLALLPSRKASVTGDGILVHSAHGMLYNCDYARENGWFARANKDGAWTITVRFEPRLVDTVYLPLDRGRQCKPCTLREKFHRFLGLSWAELEEQVKVEAHQGLDLSTFETQVKADLNAVVKTVVAEAVDRQRQAAGGSSIRRPRRGRSAKRKIRQRDRRAEDHARAFRPTTDGTGASLVDNVVPSVVPQHACQGEHRWIAPIVNLDEQRRMRGLLRPGVKETTDE